MTQEAVKYAFYFLIVGVAIWESSWAEISCLMWTGGRQSTRMRIKYLEAALDQDIQFFDTEVRTSDVVFAINADAVMVQDSISEKLVVLGGIHTTTLAKLSGKSQEALSQVGNIVEQTVVQIRVVLAYVGETKALQGYSSTLRFAQRIGFLPIGHAKVVTGRGMMMPRSMF